MSKIRIIKAPKHKAPEWVCKAWIGLELPIDGNNTIEYLVETETALDILRKINPNAEHWWVTNIRTGYLPWLFFKKEICTLIIT